MDGLQSQCRECICANGKKWREENPEKWRAARGRWKAANPEKVRAIHRNTSHKRYRQKRGGLGAAALLAWEAAQSKVCHWCGIKCPSCDSIPLTHVKQIVYKMSHEQGAHTSPVPAAVPD